jgi:hypothetical protein
MGRQKRERPTFVQEDAGPLTDAWIVSTNLAASMGLARKTKSADGKNIVFIVHCAADKQRKADPREPIAITVPCVPDYWKMQIFDYTAKITKCWPYMIRQYGDGHVWPMSGRRHFLSKVRG